MSDKADKRPEPSERFRSRMQALEWLQANGYKVSTGKFYQDCNDGFPAVATDGSVSKYQVLTYGLALNKAMAPDPDFMDKREYEHRKIKAEAEMAEIKAERMRKANDMEWLHAVDAWAAVAGLVGSLRDAIRHQLYTSQREIVHCSGGDQDRSQEVFEMMDKAVDKAFNEIAGSSIEITFAEERDEQT